MILAGNIGGTKTLVGLFERADDLKNPTRQQSFPSQRYSSLEDIIAEFLADEGVKPNRGQLFCRGRSSCSRAI